MTAFYWAIEYLVSFIEALMSFVFCGVFLNKRKELDFKYPVVISLGYALLLVLLGMIKLFSAVNTAVNFIILAAILFLYFHSKPLKTLITLVSYYGVVFITDLVTTAFTSSFSGTTISELFSTFSVGRVITSLTSKAILIVICLTFYRVGRKKNANNTKAHAIFSLFSVSLLLVSVMLYFGYSKNNSGQTNFTLSFFFIVILMLIVAVYLVVTYFFDSQQKQQEFELAKQQSQMLERSLKEQENTFSLWRKSVHDYKNTVLALDAMIKNGDTDKLSEYLEQEKQSFLHRAEYIHTGNMTVDTVINTKFAVAAENGIAFTVNAAMPEKCVVSDIHLASVIGNLIDNAIEAEEKENKPYIDIQISTAQSFFIIKIVNKCSAPPESTETSKSDKPHHGIGLKSVANTVKEYNGDFELTFENDQAIAKVLIPNE